MSHHPVVLTREQSRQVDRIAIEHFGIPGVVLMENAGRGCAEILLHVYRVTERVVICAGKGNNGGDGFVIARHLSNAGINVRVLLFAQPDDLKGDAAINFGIIEKMEIPIRAMADANPEQIDQSLNDAEWIVDTLLGTGVTGEVQEPYYSAIEAMNRSGKPILAIDLPSGLDCNTGEVLGVAVKARTTATCVSLKTGFTHEEAHHYVGEEIHIIDIGIPKSLFEML